MEFKFYFPARTEENDFAHMIEELGGQTIRHEGKSISSQANRPHSASPHYEHGDLCFLMNYSISNASEYCGR